jgi:superfamily II DNA or RNA helicase
MKILRQHQSETIDALETVIEGIVHLPTGSGKTFIQATTIVNNLQNDRVFVVLSPRILLTNQLYNEVKEILYQNQKDCQYLIVHSGKAEDKADMSWSKEMPYREVKSTTSINEIKEQYESSVRENVPLIIFGTYDSSDRIVNSGIPIYMLLCDEAHYLVSTEFSWIKYEKYTDGRFQFNAERKYYFTATLINTDSDDGLGMNNSKEFGPIIYSKTPLDMVVAGEIIRPRMHLVNVTSQNTSSELDMDVNAIIDSFTEHRVHCKIGAKLLVVTKGSEHLNQIVNHPKILEELETRPNLRIFDITSAHKPRINGIIVKREEFLLQLQSMSDSDEAIILHVRILTEGIDVPGITGVMIMNNLSVSNFLQTIGRSTRLYSKDRKRLYDGSLTYNELNRFVKAFAWIIVPVYGIIGNDLRTNIQSMIHDLRTFGFNASEDVVIKESKGKAVPVPLSGLNELDTRGITYRNTIMDIVHDVEAQEIAEKLTLEQFNLSEQIKNESLDQTILRFGNII